jgi:hypothetical protein
VVDPDVDRFVDAFERRFGCSPCLIVTMRVSSKFGALRERPYKKRIYLQVLKTPKQKKAEVREFLRAKV